MKMKKMMKMKNMKRNKPMMIGLVGFLAAVLLSTGVYMFVRNRRQRSYPSFKPYSPPLEHEPSETKQELKREVTILEDVRNRTFDDFPKD